MRRTQRESTDRLEQFLAALAPDPRLSARSRTQLPVSARTPRLFDAAMESRAEASSASETRPGPDPAQATRHFGNTLFRRGRNQEAIAAFTAAEIRCRETGDTRGLARCTESRADVYCLVGQLPEALAAYQAAAALCRDAGDPAGQGFCTWGCGDVLTRLDRHPEALLAYQQAAAFFLEAGDARSRSHCVQCGGDALARLGRNKEALATCEQAQELFHHAGDVAGLGRCVQSCANALRRLRRTAEALTALEQAEAFFQSAGDDPGRGLCIESRADLLVDLGRPQEALFAYEKAAALLKRVGDDSGQARCCWGWADIAMALHQPDEALPEYIVAHRLFLEARDREQTAILTIKTLHSAGECVALHGLALPREAVETVYRLARQIDHLDAVHEGLVHFLLRTAAALSPDEAVELLDGLDAALPAPHREFLMPARMALEVAAHRRTADLADQSDAMRHAARQFKAQIAVHTSDPL